MLLGRYWSRIVPMPGDNFDVPYKGLRYLCGSAAGNGPNDENEKENGTEGIKRKTIKNETLEMMLKVIIAGGDKH
jgi:hypothetical protein